MDCGFGSKKFGGLRILGLTLQILIWFYLLLTKIEENENPPNDLMMQIQQQLINYKPSQYLYSLDGNLKW